MVYETLDDIPLNARIQPPWVDFDSNVYLTRENFETYHHTSKNLLKDKLLETRLIKIIENDSSSKRQKV